MKNPWKPLLLGSVLSPIALSVTDPLTGLAIALIGGSAASFLHALDVHESKQRWSAHEIPVAVMCVTLLLAVGWFDVLTGYEVDVSVLYFIPIGIAAWKLPVVGSSMIVALATATWMVAQFCSQHGVASTTIFWNGIIRLITFSIIEWAIRREREHRRSAV